MLWPFIAAVDLQLKLEKLSDAKCNIGDCPTGSYMYGALMFARLLLLSVPLGFPLILVFFLLFCIFLHRW